MATSFAPALVARLLSRHGKSVAFSFFLGFGLSSCSSDEGAKPEEPMAGEEAESGDQTTAVDSQEAGANAADTDKSTDTSNAELADSAPSSAPAVDPAGADSMASKLGPEPAIGDTAAGMAAPDTGDGKTTASPGAAKFIKGKGDKSKKAAGLGPPGKGGGGSGQGIYVVQAGDTLARISQKIYGGASHWQGLVELNGMSAPYLIHPGDEVKYEASNKHAKGFSQGYKAGMKTITVEQGDTLSKIAEKVLGSANAWPQLLSYNKGKIADPNLIYTGMKLSYIGKDDAPAATAAAAPKPAADVKASAKTGAKKDGTKATGKKSDPAPISTKALGE